MTKIVLITILKNDYKYNGRGGRSNGRSHGVLGCELLRPPFKDLR